jgi:hypothetical protein
LVEVCGEGAAAGFQSADSLADPCLFLAEQAEVDGVGVVGRQQLAALTVQAQQFTVELLAFLGGVAWRAAISASRAAWSSVSQGWGSWIRL